jgi:DNA-binding CsgD family transcriptional regulator
MNTLKPLTTEEFMQIAKSEHELEFVNYEEYFATQIKEARNFAIGPYYWFIGDNANLLIKVASDNIGDLTPFSKEEWTNKPTLFLVENIHPDDAFYVLSALQLAIEKIVQLPTERQSHVRVNVYARMLNAAKEYRWVLIQIPGLYVNKEKSTTCGLIMVTDLSHLNFNGRPIMMTLTDKVNHKNEYYHIAENEMKLVHVALPNITKREQDILHLMARGFNTPQIVEELNISYNTVENHKRNLRAKTNTKTSAELMNFVCSNNLF